MKVTIEVEFEVAALDGDDELTIVQAKDAAKLAMFNHGAFSNTGYGVQQAVDVDVGGFGRCTVKLLEEEF